MRAKRSLIALFKQTEPVALVSQSPLAMWRVVTRGTCKAPLVDSDTFDLA